jgi:hypothetical protein
MMNCSTTQIASQITPQHDQTDAKPQHQLSHCVYHFIGVAPAVPE